MQTLTPRPFVPSVRALLPASLATLLAACAGPRAREAGSTAAAAPAGAARTSAELEASAPAAGVDPFAPAPWTDAFLQRAVIVADHVRIEGPPGLLDHCVVSSDDAYYEREVTQAGATLTQVTVRRSPEVPEIRAQLDQWQFAAFERVTVVERHDAVEVSVVATGEACLRDPLGKEERGETLRWVGTIRR